MLEDENELTNEEVEAGGTDVLVRVKRVDSTAAKDSSVLIGSDKYWLEFSLGNVVERDASADEASSPKEDSVGGKSTSLRALWYKESMSKLPEPDPT